MADTETGWSKGLPARSGWYFMRNEGEGVFAEGMIVWVGHNRSGVRHEGEFMYAAHPWLKRREFLGPILHSDFEQLLRLRKIAEDALQFRIEMNGACGHDEYMTKLCTQCEIREALAHTGEQS